MDRIQISEVGKHINAEVTLEGFLQIIRDQGKIIFIVLRDISGTVQGVITKEHEDIFETIRSIQPETVLRVTGKAVASPQAPDGHEVQVESVEVLSKVDEPLPIPILEKGGDNEADQALRMDWRWLDLRRPEKLLIFQVWTAMERGFIDYGSENGFIRIHSPKLTSSPSESGAEVFEVKYFDKKGYLAQSPQFYKQMAMAAGFEKVIEVGPVFRADPSFTTRHATEFTGFDSEISYINDHFDVMTIQEQMIVSMLNEVKKRHGEEVKKLYNIEVSVPKAPFPKLTMKEAKEILGGLGAKSEKSGDLSPEEERRLGEYIKEKENHDFVYVTDYPHEFRPFYHMRYEDNPEITKSFDLLYKGVEITTGAQREHRYDVLMKQAEEKGVDIRQLSYYLDFFKYGCPPHGGFGMGPGRIVMKMLDLESIREASFVYRGVKRLTP